jgi:hypothetical protein
VEKYLFELFQNKNPADAKLILRLVKVYPCVYDGIAANVYKIFSQTIA